MEQGYSGLYEKEYIRKDGAVFPVELRSYVVRRDDGAIDYLWGIARDISERKRAEEALRKERDLSNRIISDGPLAITIVDGNGSIVFANRQAEDVLGLKCSEIAGRAYNAPAWHITNLDGEPYPDEDLPFRKIMATGKAVHTIQHAILWPDGTRKILSISGAPLKDKNGRIERIVFAIEDITERKQTERVLKQHSHVLEHSPNAVYVSDEQGRLVYCNAAASMQTGYACDEIIGRTVWEIDADVSETKYPSFFTDLSLTHSITLRTRHRRADGSFFPVEISLSKMEHEGTALLCGIARDITEQIAREERIALLGRMLDAAPASITIHDTDGRFAYANQATLTLHGYSDMSEFLSVNLHDLDVPESEALMAERFRKIAEEGEARFEVAHFRKDGSSFPLEVLAKKIEWNRRPAVLSIATDITERKKAETQLRLHSLVLNQIEDRVTLTNLDGIITYVNEAEIRSLGYTREELIGSSTAKYGEDPKRGARQREILEETLRNGHWRGEVVNYTADGREMILDCRTMVVVDERGEKIALCGVSTDITERKKAEEALLESETKFYDLFHKHAAVKLIIDPDTGNIMDANEAAAHFYGWSVEKLRQMRIQEINTLSPEQVEAEMKKAKENQRVYFDFCHRLADGSVRDVAVYSSRVDIKGKTLLHSIIHDITNQRRLEEQLRQAQKMESVGRLAGGVAHDFNNMLGAILGYTDLLLTSVDPSNPMHADLAEIKKAAQRSADLTRQLLAFARKQTIAPKVLDLNEIIESMLKMLRRLIGEDIELVWRPGVDLQPVRIDPVQIDQILANLCVNARYAIGHNVGAVIIETDHASFDEAYCADHVGFVPGEFIMLAVSDNGRGMDEETRKQIFEPFFTTKGVGEGTGLGLATIYGIIKQNNGFINVYSELGQGTTFRIYLPVHKVAREITARGKAVTESVTHGSESILLVEDEPAILALGIKMLDRLGYKTLAAGTPGEAIRLAEEHAGEIHLLITDVIMPEMNGRDLAKQLVSLYPSLKSLFMSGYTANVIAHHGVLDEGTNFIQKPFSMRDLGAKVRDILDR